MMAHAAMAAFDLDAFGLCGGLSMQPCHAQMPSVRLKIAVVGTGGVPASDPPNRPSSSSARRPLAIS
jgi:hypothetical protein